jgi:Fe-S cluster biogenesis protein NfuA
LRPHIQNGIDNIQVINLTDERLRVRLSGNCEDYLMSQMTMTVDVEEAITWVFPQRYKG